MIRRAVVKRQIGVRWCLPPVGAMILACVVGWASGLSARQPDEVVDIWPERAPGETTRATGEPLPRRPNEDPPATRVRNITRPQLHVYRPARSRGSQPRGSQAQAGSPAVLIFPGGGYNYVVTDKEGSEAAEWLNELGITAFVVHYRTKSPDKKSASAAEASSREDAERDLLPPWSRRPLQDGQRALSLVRQQADRWRVRPDRIGVLGFSAGGQAAALVATRFERRAYEPLDEVDRVSCRPDFSMLVYPWRLLDEETGELNGCFPVTKATPPTFLVHAHDDHATSLGSVLFYAALKRQGVSGELHVYASGGHGYGMRPVADSPIDTWPARAADWLRLQRLLVE